MNEGIGDKSSFLTDEIDPLWRELSAAGGVEPVRAEVIAAARAAVRRAAEAELRPPTAPDGSVSARVRRGRRLVAGVGCAAAVLAVLVLAPTLPLGGDRPAATATAAEFLRHAAAQVSLAPAPNSNFYRVEYESSGALLPQGGRETPVRIVQWYGRDGAVYVSRNGSAPEGSATGRTPNTPLYPLGTGASLSAEQLRALSADPAVLSSLLRTAGAGGRADPASTAFDVLGQLLATAPLSGAQRRALLTVAAQLPGASMLGPTTDRVGRDGVAMEVVDAAANVRLVVTADGLPLESTVTPRRGSVPQVTTYISARGVGVITH